jgi:succinylglutamate desuccinylase
MLTEWLDQALAGREPVAAEEPLTGGHARLRGPGLLELCPDTPGPCARAGVISAGIHGDETAPIELLGALLARLEAGLVPLGAPLLVILGNPEAIRRGVRFVDTNLNRLFRPDLAAPGMEPDRARTLMTAVDAFHARHEGLPRLHYDLHTAIRASRFPRFAVEPFGETVTPPEQWRWLAGAGIQAVLHQHRHSWTFSHYSRHRHGAAAFTLELGRVAPFGHNDLAPLARMARLLEALVAGHAPVEADPHEMAFFRVEHELMRAGAGFRLCFPDDTPNFTEFTPGTRLAEDGEHGETRVGERPQSVVFPNASVEIGARAALLAVPVSPPGDDGPRTPS